MKAKVLIAALPIIMLAAGGAARAQDSGVSQPPAKQSAPSDSSHASGHDVQTGKPETGEIRNTEPRAGSGQSKSEAETTGGAATQRLDVPPKGVKR